jgi:hypothetical protein
MLPFLNSSRRRRAALLAVSVLAASAALGVVTAAAPAAASTEDASPCLPYQPPGLPGAGGGEITSMNDVGLYVGGATDASGGRHPAWWTHTGADLSTGWTLHVPDIPVSGEFLDVNASGVMSGYSPPLRVGFVYDSNTGDFTRLPDFGSGYDSWARRINASGVVSGNALDADDTPYAAVWRPPYTTAERLHAPGESKEITFPDGTRGKIGSDTSGINDQGTVAGYTFLGGPVDDVAQYARNKQWHNVYAPLFQAFTASADGGHITQLPASVDQAYGFAINNAGLVVGASLRDAVNGFLPAYWRNGVEYDLATPTDAFAGRANNVSQGGWVIGYVRVPGGTFSFVWTGAGSVQLNQPLPGYEQSISHGLSERLRQLTGNSFLSDGTIVPTVWQCPANFTTG